MADLWVRITIYVVASGAALLIAGCLYQSWAEARDVKRFPPPGRMVDVGGHKLHLLCKGNAGPTVVIEQGAAAPSIFWWGIQDRVAEFARVCVYDRAGLGWSEPARGPRTIEDRAEELGVLLAKAQVPGPYIFVAHSYGGWIARSFAREHREKTAGLVLVDTGEERMFSQSDVVAAYSKFRFMAIALGWATRCGLLRVMRPAFLRASAGGLAPEAREVAAAVSLRAHCFFAAADELRSGLRNAASWRRQADASGTFGNLPITVITHGQPFPPPYSVLEKHWSAGQERLAALSSASTLVVAEKSSHMIHDDEPELVVDAIRRIVMAVRDQNGLQREPAGKAAAL